MNSLTLLIIGLPAVLAVVAFKRHQRQIERDWDICWGGPGKRPSTPKVESTDWQWPDRSWAHSRTEEK